MDGDALQLVAYDIVDERGYQEWRNMRRDSVNGKQQKTENESQTSEWRKRWAKRNDLVSDMAVKELAIEVMLD